jgi:para-nitrobenzyl esterase
MLFPVALTLLISLSSCTSLKTSDPSIVVIPNLGSVRGVLNSLAREFHAVPYASPPVRFAAPVNPLPWTGIRDATTDGPGCMQSCTEPAGVCPASVSEDCLLVNIFTPLTATSASRLPVIVFLHGGAFRDGFGGGELYNGTYLASGGVPAIVVTVSYRLGSFGFLYGAGGNDAAAPTGNYGLLDQRQALIFVRDHIAAFGGDKTRVTLWGQSAGSMSAAAHLIAPASAGLFAAAALDSEPLALPFRDTESARALYTAVVVAAGCEGATSPGTCLLTLTSSALLAAQNIAYKNITVDLPFSLLQAFVPFTPTTGTPDAPNAPLASFQGLSGAARVADIPIVLTTVKSEGTIFIYEGFGAPLSPIDYTLTLAVIFGTDAAVRVEAQYPAPPGVVDLRALTANVTTALLFRCAARNATRLLAASPERKSPIYLGEWARLLSWAPALWTNATKAYEACWTNVCHAQELPFLFFPQMPGRTDWNEEETLLSSAARSYLTTFAVTAGKSMGDGTANGDNVTPLIWPALDGYTGATPRMTLDAPVRRIDDADDEACALFNQIGYDFY